MSAAAAPPGRTPGPGTAHPSGLPPALADSPVNAASAGLAGPAPGLSPNAPWLAAAPNPARDPWLPEDSDGPIPGVGDCFPDDCSCGDCFPGHSDDWLADALAGDRWLPEDDGQDPLLVDDPWPAGDPVPADPPPGVPEVFKAGRWDRSRGTGGGFAAGGVADHLPPGAVLAGLAGDLWAAGLGRLADDELIGVVLAARRLTSWATAMELAALADLWRRRTAEEDAGDRGAAEHAADEVAAALTLTGHAADTLLDLAITLGRLPLTSAALAAGDIDVPRAKVIADQVTGLSDDHAAAVEQAVIGRAVGQTTGQLRAAAHQAALAADPAAAAKRKEQALRQARVERWSEGTGTAALAGRDLPPAPALAADTNLTTLANDLKAAGVPGTLDTLRASVYLALLAGTPLATLLPAGPAGTTRAGAAPSSSTTLEGGWPRSGQPGNDGWPADRGPGRPGQPGGDLTTSGQSADDWPGDNGLSASERPSNRGRPHDSEPASPGQPGSDRAFNDQPGSGKANAANIPGAEPGEDGRPCRADWPRPFPATATSTSTSTRGSINLTLPLATWLGISQEPGHAAGHGPLDATDSRELANALAAHPGNQLCLTLTGPDGRPVAHGCARTGPPSGRRRTRAPTGAGERGRPPPRFRDGHPKSRDGTWTFTLTLLDTGDCDHAWQTPAYKPTPGLRHLVNIRQPTCVFPGCRRPAKQCDADHTIAYDSGGPTCLCNLAPLCRRHHRTKQAPGWALTQTTPGAMTWTTPSGRRYTLPGQ